MPPWSTARNIQVEIVPLNRSNNPGVRRSADDQRQEHRDGDPHRDAVHLGDGGDVEPVPTGRLVTGVRAGSGDHGAGDEGRCDHHAERHEEAGDERGDPESMTPTDRLRPRAVQGDETEADRQHGQDEMGLHEEGCRSPRTAIPPTTPLPRIVASTASDGTFRPRRTGRTRNAPIAISSVGMPTRPLTRRLICSMAAWPLDTSMNRSLLQFGQSSQPRPLPVSRTMAPATVRKHTPATVMMAICR